MKTEIFPYNKSQLKLDFQKLQSFLIKITEITQFKY